MRKCNFRTPGCFDTLSMVGLVLPAALLCAGCGSPPSDSETNVRLSARSSRSGPTGWPGLFGPNRDSRSPETDLQTTWDERGPTELWRASIGTGYASPVVVDDRLIIHHRIGDEEHLDAYDPLSGERVWRDSHPTSFKITVDYSDGPYSTPLIHLGKPGETPVVISVSAEGTMRCNKLADGALLWQRHLHQEYPVKPWLFPVGSSPIVVDGLIIFNLGSVEREAGIIALSLADGAPAWTATDHGPGYATPVAVTTHGQTYVLVATFEGLVAVAPKTGQVYWHYPLQPKSPDSVNATSPAVCNDKVIMVTGPGPGAVGLRLLPDGKYEEVWRTRRILDSQFNTLIPFDDYLFGYTASRQGGAFFRCVDANTGQLKWEWQSDLGRGSGLAVDGHFILWGEAGHLASLEIRTDKPVVQGLTGDPVLDAPCYASPALHQGLLYLRNNTTILCLDLRRSGSPTDLP